MASAFHVYLVKLVVLHVFAGRGVSAASCPSGSDDASSDDQALLSLGGRLHPLRHAKYNGVDIVGLPSQKTKDSEDSIPMNERPRGAPDRSSGQNVETDYVYSYKTDCYGDGSGQGYVCPEGQWCQVSTRDNWYPWDVSYMNRGRCLPYVGYGAACEPPFEGQTAFPRKANGDFYERATLCAPDLICTGDTLIHTLPPTCTYRRIPEVGCMSSKPFCAGRPAEGGCPPTDSDYCMCPLKTKRDVKHSSCYVQNHVMDRTKLEQCGSVFNSFNGPNFAFSTVRGGLPNDNNIEGGTKKIVHKDELFHGPNAAMANNILKQLWPYPVCDPEAGVTEDCTQFPLPVTTRDYDGGLTGNVTYADGTTVPAPWLRSKKDPRKVVDGNGVIDYHCSWMIMHTLSFNGPQLLSGAEQTSFAEMIMYVTGQFDCKVCRNNFVHIVEQYGLPSGSDREVYAHWLWQAHNIANEHTYATHSPSNHQIAANNNWTLKDRRWDMWGNPVYMHPWFLSFADAERLWKGIVHTRPAN